MNIEFFYKNLSCCSLELHWNYNSKEKKDLDYYELFQREGDNNIITNIFKFTSFYKGKNTHYEVINLKPNQIYTFKLKVITIDSSEEKIIKVKTLSSPHAILSEKSFERKNGEITEEKEKLSDFQQKIIKNCSKFVFDENDENILKGDFNGIKIKITNEIKNNTYYISFDVESYYFYEFFKQYIKECDTNIIIPCHFIIQKLPTILIFNLLEKSSIIFTGKRMGGVIASSLAFYIMYIGKSMNINYNNAFLKNEKKSFGVVTFGSPAFLNNLTAAYQMKDLASYFYHIKEEFDYIPEIVDFISHYIGVKKQIENIFEEKPIKQLFQFFNKIELDNKEIELLDNYLTKINFNEDNLKKFIDKFIRIPFGYYYMMKTPDFSLLSINEYTFEWFYYFKKFNSTKTTSHLKIYKKLESNVKFNKKPLKDLESKENQLELIKIIRRNNESNSEKPNKNAIKAIIKFELDKSNNNIITPDIIKNIYLSHSTSNREIIINNNEIYYDNDTDITAYTDILAENFNLNTVTITNYFSGEIKIKYILNIKGSGPTRTLLYDNLEKIFLIPFFKLFEIFYISFKDEEKYNKLKEENFGKNFEELKILKPFEKQIKIFNELLLFTRPDIIANKETKLIDTYIRKDLKDLKGVKEDSVIKNIEVISKIIIGKQVFFKKNKILIV